MTEKLLAPFARSLEEMDVLLENDRDCCLDDYFINWAGLEVRAVKRPPRVTCDKRVALDACVKVS